MQRTSREAVFGWLARVAGVAVLYLALGRLALLVAIPPGYATAVWPAAGVALAGVLLFGSRVWPGVFLGSLLVNSATALDITSLDAVLHSMALPAAIAGGASLQAVVGAYLVRCIVGFPSNLDRLGRVAGTMFVGGPLACLISATIGVVSLLQAGSIDGAAFARSWGTWWLGDSIGVLVIIPLVSAWGMGLHRGSRRTRLFVAVPVLAVLAMTVIGSLDARQRELLRAQAEFERRAEIIARTLEQSVHSEFEVLRSLVSLFETRGRVDRADFEAFVRPVFRRHSDLHGLSWNAVVSGDGRAALEEGARQEGFADFQITERDAYGALARAGERDEYVVVFYMEPYRGNEQALGYDLNSNPDRAGALAEARDSGAITATPPILLVQETEERPGFLFFAPVYKRGLPRDTVDERRRNLHSFVSGVFRARALVEEALKAFQGEGVGYRIVDTTHPEEARVLYEGLSSSAEVNRVAAGLSWSAKIDVAGRRWTMEFRPASAYATSSQWSKVWGILTGGLLFSSLLGAFLVVVAGRASAIERSEETLRVNQRRLLAAQRIAQFASWEWDSRSDVVWLSEEAYRILGVSAKSRETSFDAILERIHPDDSERVRQALEDALAGKRAYDVEYRLVRPDGTVRTCHTVGEVQRSAIGSAIGMQGTIHDITEKKQAEQRAAHFSSVLESSLNEIYAFDPETLRFIEVNRGARENLGYSLEELRGLTPLDLKPELTAEEFSALLEPLRSGRRETVHFETFHRRKDGSKYPVEVHLQLVGLAEPVFVAIILDVTERRAREQMLRRTQFSVDHAADGIFWVLEDGSFSYVNEAACRMTGHERESLLRMSVFDIDPNYAPETWPEFWEVVKQADDLVIESLMRRKNGTMFPTEIAINFLEVDGVGHCFATARDNTERKRAEEERQELEAKVQEAQRLESLGVLAGGIAHDFNNLLVGVLANAALAQEEMAPDAPAREVVRDIEASAERAADLANQLLAYSGRGRFVVEPLDLSSLVDEIAHLAEVSVSKNVEVVHELSRDLPSIECDATQVRQVVLNLITNASEAVGGAAGVVTIRTGQMDGDAAYLSGTFAAEDLQPGRYVFVEVVDTGCGMDEDTQRRIFDPFFTTKFTGRGLGLAAALGIVRGHKGGIELESEPECGTRIRVLFPASDQPVREADRAEPDTTDWRGVGTVLLVDDEPLVLRVVSRMLSRFGFEVVTAADGMEALEVFGEHADDVVLVLLDLTMPRMGGEETFLELRRIKADIKVILSSGYVEQDSTSQFAGRGLAGFIQKPYRLAPLRDRIREVLES